MGKPIEEHLAEYLLGLQRGSWTSEYNRQCVALWRKTYGNKVAERAEAIAKSRWKK